MLYKFVYVILHYGTYEETVNAIESILKKFENKESLIVVVDNASPEQSGQKLREIYEKNARVHVLINEKNYGFAIGNNIGYEFARDKLKADFIITMNNDVEILQSDFEQRVADTYQELQFHILGPDIVTPQGEHRNPHRKDTFVKTDLNRIIRNRSIIFFYLKVKQTLGLEQKIHFIEDWDTVRIRKERNSLQRNVRQTGVVLQGSFFVFSPDYLENESRAFCPETFLYMEEEILAYQSKQKGYILIYEPGIKVLHKEEAATTQMAEQKQFDKYMFYTYHLRNSAKVMKKIIMGRM